MEGSLSKWTNVMKGWQYRWFVLDDNSGLLSYYTSKEKMMRGVRRGCVRLKGAIIGIDDEDDSTFTITVDHKTFHFQARDAVEREKWVRALEDTIFRHGSRMKWDNYQPPPTIKDFQYKVTEADAYLQLMIEQIKKLEENIGRMCEPEDKSKCQIILDHANVMLDNVKHSIVLLQIAKNTAHPVNGLGLYQLLPGSSTHTTPQQNAETLVPEGPVLQSGVELGMECRENARRKSRTLTTPTSLAVPDMSYSSSEGEDDFFDANDYPTTGSAASSPSGLKTFDSNGDNTNNSIQIRQQPPPTGRKISNKSDNIIEQIDDDSLYDDESDDNLEIDSNVSVIRHLLSQVKIGMDLTKVVLPTFILERRSLLEMYADYFAHPDLFLSIADAKDPRERMVQVVKWYLSSYHAGRKSAVAKKPYNPILGEFFRCHWNIPDSYKLPSNDEIVPNGPISGCTKNQLSFVAEQVSHHPPISAFYAEHYNKRISFSGHVYTKSKFLGLSVCVYNIGQGVVSVLDHDEEYIVTFPNGYGRSILTVPWIELGGSIAITCRQTGYYCNLEFITKPFYGNKKHRISAEIFGPEEKKPFLTVTGEWNGIMEAKSNDKNAEEFVIDVNKLEIVKKQVRPINQQEDNESRKVWKDVTLGLRVNDIDKATAAKQHVEQKQREEAKDRKESGMEWQTKFFQRGPEDTWLYIKPLRQRLTTSNT